MSQNKAVPSGRQGFTLIELLIVIAIIVILAAVVFVAIDPLTRFRDSRDARRWSEITTILEAVKKDQVDNGGTYLTTIISATEGTVYMVGTAGTGCILTCDATIVADGDCINLTGLVTEGYLGSVPISPNGAGSWSAATTGYYLVKNTNGTVKIGACESENTDNINVTR